MLRMIDVSVLRQAAITILALCLLITHVSAESARLAVAPFKDDLFAYPGILDSEDGGVFIRVKYNKWVDVHGRDTVPERKVHPRYVSLRVRRDERRVRLPTPVGEADMQATGVMDGARFIVLFVHGRGGDRRLASNDWNFGGNFNRIKNIAVMNGGLYLSPTIPSFDTDGAVMVESVIATMSARSPGAPVIVACGSMGSLICWQLARNEETVSKLGGMIIMGGVANPEYPQTPAYRKKLPIFFSHGSIDPVYDWRDQKAQFDMLRKRDYPTRFVLFDTGGHGSPIRMTDWRDALNWILVR